jgi:uncharacterized delta-60 repeat protein
MTRRVPAPLIAAAFAAARLSAITLDASFGQGGKVITPFPGPQSTASAVLVQPDGRIVAAGSVGASTARRVAIARYDSRGNLDPSFGSGGQVVTDAGGFESYATGLALQADGKILVSGAVVVAESPADSSFLVMRYQPDGALDPTFGTGGIVTTDLASGGGGQDGATSLAVGADGRIVAGGFEGLFGSLNGFAVVRYDSSGNLDATFGSGGRVRVKMGAGLSDSLNAVAVDANGNVTGCGTSDAFPLPFDRVALIRLVSADGSLDPAFGSGGRVYAISGIGGSACDGMRLLADGKTVAFATSGTAMVPVQTEFAVFRFLGDGSLDPAFGTGGFAVTLFDGNSNVSGGAMDGDGRIVEAGSVFNGPDLDFALARFRADGAPDATFSPTGRLRTNFGGHDGANAAAIQSDGRIVLAGFAGPESGIQFALARYVDETVAVPALSPAALRILGGLLAVAGVAALRMFGAVA